MMIMMAMMKSMMSDLKRLWSKSTSWLKSSPPARPPIVTHQVHVLLSIIVIGILIHHHHVLLIKIVIRILILRKWFQEHIFHHDGGQDVICDWRQSYRSKKSPWAR